MSKRTSALIGGTILLASGCATYVEPTSGETAQLQFGGHIGYVSVGYEGRCSSTASVDLEKRPIFKVRAGGEVLVRFESHSAYAATCKGDMFFTPKGGRRYLLSARIGERACTAKLESSSDGNFWVEDTPYRTEPPRGCLFGS